MIAHGNPGLGAMRSARLDEEEEEEEGQEREREMTSRQMMAVIRAARPEFKSKMDRVAFAVHASTLIATEMAKRGMELRGGTNDEKEKDAEGGGVEMVLVGVGREAETASEAEGGDAAGKEEEEVGVEGWNDPADTGVAGGGYAFRYTLMNIGDSAPPTSSSAATAAASTNDDGAGVIAATTSRSRKTVLIKAVAMEHVLVVSALVTGWTSPFTIELDVNTFTNQSNGLVDGFANVDRLSEILAAFVATIVHGKAKRDDAREARDRGEDAEATVLIDEQQRVGHDPLRVPRMRPGGHVGPTIAPHPLSVGGHDLDPFQPSMIGIPGRGPLGPQPGNVVGPDHPLFSGRMPPPRPYPGFGGGGFGGGGGFYPPPSVPPGARFDPYGPPGVPDFPGPGRYPPGYGHPDLPQPPDGDDGPPPPSMFM